MISAYKQQIENLAKSLNCQLDVDSKFRTTAMMYVEEEPPRIEVPPINNQVDYLINLHELGHVANGDTQGRPPFQHKKDYFDKGVLRCEREAWEWAISHCLDELLDESRYFIWDTCIGSYYKYGYIAAQGQPTMLSNGNRHHVEFIFDEPDKKFDEFVVKVQNGLSFFKIEYFGKVEFKH